MRHNCFFSSHCFSLLNDLATNCYKKKAKAMQANIVVFHSLNPSCLFFSLLFTCLLSVIVCCVCCIMFDQRQSSLFQIKFSRNRHTPFIRFYWTSHTCGSMVLWLTQSPYTPKFPGLRHTHSFIHLKVYHSFFTISNNYTAAWLHTLQLRK